MVAAAAAAADRVGAALEESLELQELRLGFRGSEFAGLFNMISFVGCLSV